MNIQDVTITMTIDCRNCDDGDCEESVVIQGDGVTVEEAEKDIHEQLEAEGWTDGFCPDCAEKQFLNPADKADHDNKIQHELDP